MVCLGAASDHRCTLTVNPAHPARFPRAMSTSNECVAQRCPGNGPFHQDLSTITRRIVQWEPASPGIADPYECGSEGCHVPSCSWLSMMNPHPRAYRIDVG